VKMLGRKAQEFMNVQCDNGKDQFRVLFARMRATIHMLRKWTRRQKSIYHFYLSHLTAAIMPSP